MLSKKPILKDSIELMTLINNENQGERLPAIKSFILENKEHPDIMLAIGNIAGCAIRKNALKVCALIINLGYDLSSIKDEASYLLLHNAAESGYNDALTFFKEANVNLEIQNWQGLTPLYAAMHAGEYNTALHLQKLGCKVDPSRPIIKKISPYESMTLLEACESSSVNISELLASNGYSLNLDYQTIIVPETIKSINFDGVSLVYADIFCENPTKFSFKGSNLKHALLHTSPLSDDLTNLEDANLEEATFLIEENFYKKLPGTQIEKSNAIIIDPETYFCQNDLIDYFELKDHNGQESDGDCLGLVIEYGRHILRNQQKGKAGNLEQSFIKKLQRKFQEPAGNATSRIHSYQCMLQTRKVDKGIYLDLDTHQKFIDSLSELGEADLIHASVSCKDGPEKSNSLHSIAIRKLKSGGYAFFNPTYGEKHFPDSLGLYKELIKNSTLHRDPRDGNQCFFATNLKNMIDELGLVSNNKDSKHIYILYQALKKMHIGGIMRFSSAQKIDMLGYIHMSIGSAAFMQSTNPLTFAISTCPENVIIALISSNTKLDLNSRENVTFILLHLMNSEKLTKPIINALRSKAEELHASLESIALIDAAYDVEVEVVHATTDDEFSAMSMTINDSNLMDSVQDIFAKNNWEYSIRNNSTIHTYRFL